MLKQSFLIIAAFLIGLAACEEEQKSYDKALLNDTSWKMTAKEASPGIQLEGYSEVVTDLYKTMADCEKDDILRFNADGTYQIKEGESSCDTSYNDDMKSGDWMLVDDNTKIKRIGMNGMTTTWKIKTLNDSKLVVTYEASVEGSETQDIKVTYEKVN